MLASDDLTLAWNVSGRLDLGVELANYSRPLNPQSDLAWVAGHPVPQVAGGGHQDRKSLVAWKNTRVVWKGP